MGSESKEVRRSALPEPHKVFYMSKSQLFKDIPEDRLASLAGLVRMDDYSKGQPVFGSWDESETLYLLKRGKVRLYRIGSGGKDLTLEILGPGAVFGEMTLLGQSLHGAHAQAVEASLVCRMRRADVQKMLTELPQVAMNALEILAQRTRWLQDQLEDIGLRQAKARIASHILRLPFSHDSGGSKVLTMRYTQEELGKLANLARETASLAVNELKSQGLVDITEEKHIRILDESALAAVAAE